MSELTLVEQLSEAKKAYLAMGFLVSRCKSKKHEVIRNEVMKFIGNILVDIDIQLDELKKGK